MEREIRPEAVKRLVWVDAEARPLTAAIVERTIESEGRLICSVDGEMYQLDTGATVTAHQGGAIGSASIQVELADGTVTTATVAEKHGIKGVSLSSLGLPLLALKDLARAEPARPAVRYMKPVKNAELIDKMVAESATTQPDRLRAILGKGVYSQFKNDCGRVDAKYTYTIRGGVPPRQPQHRVDPRCVEELTGTIQELVELGVLKQLQNAVTNTPILGVPKPDATWRMVHNLIALNKRSLSDTRSTLNPSRTVRTLPNCRWKSSIDLANGFWSVPIDELSTAQTAFTWGGDSYGWCVLPMGFKNSAVVFQAVLEDILQGLEVVIYIDDVYWTHDDEDQHLQVLEQVLTRLGEAGLKVGLKKCELVRHSLKYLGFNITDTGKEVTPEMLKQLQNMEFPRTKKGLEQFLGKGEYISTHVPGYSQVVAPLHQLKGKLEKRVATLDSVAKGHWEKAKSRMLSAQPLEKREPKTALEIHTQLENGGISLECRNQGSRAPCLFLSYAFKPAETRFTPEEQTLCGVYRFYRASKELAMEQDVWVITPFPALATASKQTLEGAKAVGSRWGKWDLMLIDENFKFCSSAKTARRQGSNKERPRATPEWYLFCDGSKQGGDGPRAKWAFILKKGPHEIKRQTGWVIGSAQTAEVTAILEGLLSCAEKKVRLVGVVTDSDYCYQAGNQELSLWKDREFQAARGQPLAHAEQWAIIAEQARSMHVRWYKVKSHTANIDYLHDGNRAVDKLVQERARPLKSLRLLAPEPWRDSLGGITIPPDQVRYAMEVIHEALGHPGVRRMCAWMRRNNVSAQKTSAHARTVRRACPACARAGGFKRTPHDPEPIACAEEGVHFSSDVAGPFSTATRRGNRYPLVVVDNGPGGIRVTPLRRLTGPTIAAALAQAVIENPKMESLRMDNAPYFHSWQVQDVLEDAGVQAKWSIPYAPHTNGVSERAVRTVKDWILKNAPGNDWDTPAMLVKMHSQINVGRESKALPKRVNRTVPCAFSPGDVVWVARKGVGGNPRVKVEGQDRVSEVISDNCIRLEKYGPVHPTQIRKAE